MGKFLQASKTEKEEKKNQPLICSTHGTEFIYFLTMKFWMILFLILHRTKNGLISLENITSLFFLFLTKFNFIRRYKGAQPKYIGSTQERHTIREKKKNRNLEILENQRGENC